MKKSCGILIVPGILKFGLTVEVSRFDAPGVLEFELVAGSLLLKDGLKLFMSFSNESEIWSSALIDFNICTYDYFTILRIFKSRADGICLLGSLITWLFMGWVQSLHPTFRFDAVWITCRDFSTTT